ncbi:UNVERIFIED_CONTAM: hypothetical protein O8I53_11670 [Campylobacter lari]
MVYQANNNKYALKEFSGETAKNTVITSAFKNPKIIFAAVDYMDEQTLNQYQPKINKI